MLRQRVLVTAVLLPIGLALIYLGGIPFLLFITLFLSLAAWEYARLFEKGGFKPASLLMVIGTSAKVYPAAGLPSMVKARGGLIYEFNTEPTSLTRGETGGGFFDVLTAIGDDSSGSDYLFLGKASETMTLFSKQVLDP